MVGFLCWVHSWRKLNIIWVLLLSNVTGMVAVEQPHLGEVDWKGEDTEISSLFTSLAPKSTPLYVCDASLGGIEYRPPGAIDCDTDPEDNDTVSVVDITVYFNDLTHHAITGYECTGWIDKVTLESNGFTRWTTVRRLKGYVTPEECWEMISHKKDPKGNKLDMANEETWQTNNKVNKEHPPWYYVWYEYHHVVFNYKIQEVSIGITEADGTVKSIAFTDKPCHYNESYCATDLGFLVWKSTDVKTCRLLEGDKSNCLFRIGNDGKTLTCPDLKIVLRDFEFIRMCGTLFGSSHGVYFLQNQEGQFSKEMGTPEQIRKLLSKPRKKREVQNRRVHAFEAEMKLNLNFLYDTLRNHTREVMRKLEKDICEVTKRQVEMISTIAQLGHPSLTMKYMNDIPSLRAEYVGDLLQIYQCVEINEWKLEERKECTFQWPVKYVFRHNIFHGYIEPITHSIIKEPVKQILNAQGGCKKFYFQANNYVVRLVKDEAIRVNVEQLPFPSVEKHGKNFLPDLTFIPTGKLAESADEQYASVLKLFKSSGIRSESYKSRPLIAGGESITVSNGNSDISSGFDSFISGFLGQLLTPFWSFFAYFIQFLLWGLIIGIVGIVLLILIKTQLLFAIFKFPLQLMFALLRSCWKGLCKRQIRRLVRSRRIHEYDFEHNSKPILF